MEKELFLAKKKSGFIDLNPIGKVIFSGYQAILSARWETRTFLGPNACAHNLHGRKGGSLE